MKRTIDLDLQYAPKIDRIPERMGDVYGQACSGDSVTIESWRKTWIKNYQASKDRFGEFAPYSYGQLFGTNRHRPAIIIGSGPSLKFQIEALKENKLQPHPVTTVSCLHNFGLFEDEGCHADYYVTLDSGPIVIQDIYDGRKQAPEIYWEATKGKTLIANIATDPGLFDKWRGKIYLFNTLIPDPSIREEFGKIERFSHYISTGGNALGACLYTAKVVMGSSDIIFVGADFCFDFDKTFHAYPTQYDSYGGNGIGHVVSWPTVFGKSAPYALTWPSYFNFKLWMDWIVMNIPGLWASASYGIFGAYEEGNLSKIRYGSLSEILEPYRITDVVQLASFKFENGQRVPLLENGVHKKEPHFLSEMFKDSQQPLDITVF